MTKARCNPLWQPIPCPLSDIEGLESWLGDMAAQGLVPVTIGQNFARFRCSQPKAVRYRLNAKPMPETFLESAPGTPDGEERALAQECGWYYVTAVGDFFLYACEDSDAPELNTDPQVQALSLRYAKRQVFAPAGLLAYWLVTFWVRYAMGVWHTPVIDFVELGWLSFCYLGLLAAALVSVVHNTVLLYRFSARLTRGAEPERHKNWRKGAGRYLVGRVLAALPRSAHVVALDGRGKAHASEALAQRLEHWRGQGRDLAFLIGGPEGHAPEVLQRADERWSLGPLTLPHMLARLVVAEQIYRAAAMLANHPYHRA